MDNLYIVMPAYNEETNIESVIEEWYPILEGKENSKLIIADSGSTDSTHDILVYLQKKYDRLVVISDSAKEHGPKLIALYKYAIKEGADYIFQTDSDGQTSPYEFDQFWKQRKEYDAIIGQRPNRGDGVARKYVEKVVCILLNIFFRVTVSDANAPFRLMRSDLVEKYIYRIPNEYNIPNIMLTTYFCYYKENVNFKDITFAARRSGKNSINLAKICKIGWKALHDFAMFRKEMFKG